MYFSMDLLKTGSEAYFPPLTNQLPLALFPVLAVSGQGSLTFGLRCAVQLYTQVAKKAATQSMWLQWH